jgi:preprotein translocase subunit YajC
VTFDAATSSSNTSPAGLIFPLLLVGLLVLLFMNQRRRSRATQEVQRQLRPGMKVMTTAGLYAEIQAVEDDQVHLEIAPGVICRFSRAAVARVIDPPGDEPMEAADDDRGEGGSVPGIGTDRRDEPPPAAPAT